LPTSTRQSSRCPQARSSLRRTLPPAILSASVFPIPASKGLRFERNVLADRGGAATTTAA
jgi:hypothetical protein